MSRRGFTLLEMITTVAILSVVMLSVFTVLGRSQTLESRAIALADLRVQTRTALDTMARAVREAQNGTVNPPTPRPVGAVQITFSRPVAQPVTSTTIAFESVTIYRTPEPGETDDNDFDDNHDGLVDNGSVYLQVLPQNATRPLRLAWGVPDRSPTDAALTGSGILNEPGLWFAWDSTARSVSMGLTLCRRLRTGEVVSWTESTTVYLRNK